jgi:hypothetical protein|tara:strand:- start:79 stop:906 length:828 start_codon:yes stop_codon:yes gene_type:complete
MFDKNKNGVTDFTKRVNVFDSIIEPFGRGLYKPNANRIIKNFDDELVGELTFIDIKRENLGARYSLIDGQHRLHAIRMLFSNRVRFMMRAKVLPYREYQERAKRYVVLNTKRKNLTYIDAFKGRFESGEEKAILTMEILEKLDIGIKGYIEDRKYELKGVSIAEQLATYNVGKLERNQRLFNPFERTAKVLIIAYGHDATKIKLAMDSVMFEGIGKALIRKPHMDYEYLGLKMKEQDLAFLLGEFAEHRKAGKWIGKPAIDVHDFGLKGSKRIGC